MLGMGCLLGLEFGVQPLLGLFEPALAIGPAPQHRRRLVLQPHLFSNR
jgi:hypothetical protein